MSTISAEKYVAGVRSIYEEKPAYETGHDGSDGKCDCIGMCRGGLERGGATGVKNMRGTNQAARKTIENLRKIAGSSELKVGDVVLKTRDKDDKSMPLPDRYRQGGADYDPTLGETNFTHIGTVTGIYPLEITHMTSQTAKIDKKLGNWTWTGSLPWVESGDTPGPGPEPTPPEPQTDWAIVVAESGDKVKMRAKPTQACKLYWEVPVGAEVQVYQWNAATDKKGQVWARIAWAGQDGYMMQEFLRDEEEPDGTETWTVTISGLTYEQAEQLCMDWGNATMARG